MYFLSFTVKENYVFNEEDNLSPNVVITGEELDDIDEDYILNLEDLPGFLFIDEECRNPIIVY